MGSEPRLATVPIGGGAASAIEPDHSRRRWQIVALVAMAALAHIGWEHFNGGIQAHHLFQHADMPAMSNAWGAVLLPALAWFLSGRFLKRAVDARSARNIGIGFAAALLAGLALMASFLSGMESASFYILLGAILSGLVVRVYRGEYILGFVLGMTFAVGPVIATLAALFIAGISTIAHLLVWPAAKWVVEKLRR